MTPHRPLAMLIGVFVLLAAAYSFMVPVREAPDETVHLLYVLHLRQGDGLPVLPGPGETGFAGQEAVQPPLYYALGALVSLPTDPAGFEDHQIVNWFQQFDRYRPGNKNVVVHTGQDSLDGPILFIHAVRLLSVILGALTVLFTVLAAREAGLGQWLALIAGALVAFNPQFVFLSASVNSDNAVIAACAAGLYLSLRLMNRGPSTGLLLTLGVTVGLAAMSKISGALSGLLAVLAYLLAVVPPPRKPGWALRVLRDLTLLTLPSVFIAGWWYLRNLLLYGDPLGWNRMILAIDGILRRKLTWADYGQELLALKESFWAVFGWRNISVPGAIYHLLDGVVIAGIAGLVWYMLRRRRAGVAPTGAVLSVLVAWVVVFGAFLARWMAIASSTGQGRLLFPALPAIAILLVIGLSQLPRARLLIPAAVAGGLAALALISPFAFIQPAYATLRLVPASEAASIPDNIQARFSNVAELIGYRLEPDTLQPGQDGWLVLYWRSENRTTEDLAVHLRAVGRNYRPLQEDSSYPALGAYPFPLWSPGEIIEDRRLIRLEPDAHAPDFVRFEVSVHDRLNPDERLPIFDEHGNSPGDSLTIGPLRLAAPGGWPPAPARPISLRFDGAMTATAVLLTKYPPDGESVAGSIGVQVFWTSGNPPPGLRGKVELLDPGGKVVSASEAEPGDGWYPTRWWRPGDTIDDEYDLAIPKNPAPGSYRVRLSVAGPSGALPADGDAVIGAVSLP